MPTYEHREHIDAPPEAVWATLIDVARWPEWTPTARRLERLDSGPFAVGSRARIWLMGGMGRPSTWEATELSPGRSFAWRTGMPGVTMTATHDVEAAAGAGGATAAQLTLRIIMEGPLASVMSPWLGRVSRRNIRTEAAELKRRCEAS
jgi:carbon monoxide dehydrogenase subunit G